jgi:hypothetical protein
MTPEFSVDVVFDVYCACGAALCQQCTTQDGGRHRLRQLVVEPCEKCKDVAWDKGYEKCDAEREEAK